MRTKFRFLGALVTLLSGISAAAAREPRSYILVLASVLIFDPVPLCAQQTVHAQTTVNFGTANTTFGPVSSGCDAINGGPECKFLSFETDGTCETREEIGHANFGKCTLKTSTTVLLSFSPSGAHDQSGNPTGVCVPFFESATRSYDDGSVLDLNGQGTACCAEDSCSGGFGPPLVFRESTILTGGTGRFMSIKGNGSDSGAQYSDGTGIAQEEEVWAFPQAADTRP